MAIRKTKNNIFAINVRDWDRRLFDELIPLSDETSYNSYLNHWEIKHLNS